MNDELCAYCDELIEGVPVTNPDAWPGVETPKFCSREHEDLHSDQIAA